MNHVGEKPAVNHTMEGVICTRVPGCVVGLSLIKLIYQQRTSFINKSKTLNSVYEENEQKPSFSKWILLIF